METSALQRKGVRREGEVVWGEIRGDVSTLLRMTASRLRVERKQTVSQLCARIACPKISRSRAKERHSYDLEKRETRNARLHSKLLSNTVTGRLFAECSERYKPTNDLKTTDTCSFQTDVTVVTRHSVQIIQHQIWRQQLASQKLDL